MVNYIRRYKDPLMIIVTLMVIVAFSTWAPNLNPRAQRNQPAAVIHGKPVSKETWEREERRMKVHARMGGAYSGALDPGFMFRTISRAGVENSLLFETEADALGITATEAEMTTQLNHAFRGGDGKFEPAHYEMFVRDTLQPEGFIKADIDLFLRREVRVRKAAGLIASMVPPTPNDVKQQFLRDSLITEASYVAVKGDDLRKDIKVTDDEIKQRYETKKDILKVPEKRKVRFAEFVLPAAADGKPPETSNRTEQLQKLADAAYDFAGALVQPGANFDELAKKAGVKVGETAEFFTRDEGLVEIEKSPKAAEAAFELTKEKPYSAHISLQNGTYVLALKEIKPPEQMTIEKARTQLENELKEEKVDTALRARAEEIRKKLVEARKAGKSFSDAAQSAGLKSEPFPAFSPMQPPPANAGYGQIIPAYARKLAPGEISEVIATPGAAIIVHVDQRPAVDEKGIEAAKTRIAAGIEARRMGPAFTAWLADRRRAAGLKEMSQR